MDNTQLCQLLLNSIREPGCSEEKAKVVLAQVQALVIVNNLNLQDVLTNNSSPFITHVEFLTNTYNIQHDLATSICRKHYFVKAPYWNKKIEFMGLHDNVQTAKDVYRSLLYAFADLWHQHRLLYRYYGRCETKRRSYLTGIYDRVNARLREEKNKKILVPVLEITPIDRTITTQEKSLFSLAQETINSLNKAYREKYPSITTSNRQPGQLVLAFGRRGKAQEEISAVDYDAGYKAGAKIKLPGLES